ncbi:unnamed protein product [Calypogeia fissa]
MTVCSVSGRLGQQQQTGSLQSFRQLRLLIQKWHCLCNTAVAFGFREYEIMEELQCRRSTASESMCCWEGCCCCRVDDKAWMTDKEYGRQVLAGIHNGISLDLLSELHSDWRAKTTGE